MFFLHQIKRTSGNIDKGIVVKETLDGAEQSYHAYLGAYAYGQNPQTDYVQCMITNEDGMVMMDRTWKLQPAEVEVTEG